MSVFPNFIVNAGLFKLNENQFQMLISQWIVKINETPMNEMLLSEALLAVTYAENHIVPVSDKQDVKHFGKHEYQGEYKIAG